VDANRLVIGVQQNTLQQRLVENDFHYQHAKILTYTSYSEIVAALKKGTINVMLTEGLPGYALLKSPEGRELMIAGNYPSIDASLTDACIAVHLDNRSLIPLINEALIQLQANGVYQRLLMRYFPDMNY